jgi:Immunity protein 35
MISFKEAREIALEYLNDGQDPRLDIVADLTIEKEWGWIFSFQSKRWISSRNWRDKIIPGSPSVVIERLDGSLRYLDDGMTLEECIQKYETRRKLEISIVEAVKYNDIEQMKSIVDRGYKFTKHNSPLGLATSLGNLDIVKILVDAGCNTRWTNTNENK